MKVPYLFVLTITLGLAAVIPATAQITITAGDMSAALAPGNMTTSRIDTATHTVDIGGLGATSWDFSALVNSYSALTVPVDPDTTAFIGSFPGATHAIQVGTGYSYYTLSTNLEMLGYAQPPPAEVLSKKVPPQVISQLPMTMGTNWTATYVDSSYVIIGGTTYASAAGQVAVNTVDAYGSLTLPGGGVFQALRLKTERTTTVGLNTFRSVSYQFITKEGASVSVSPSDTNQPATGAISVSSSSWMMPASATSVEEIPGGALPADFALEQNYPNPFNPSTTIRFSVAEHSFVRLEVYDLLGRALTTLVGEPLSPGRYSVEWDGSAFPSGVYVCRLQSGASTETRTLVLMR